MRVRSKVTKSPVRYVVLVQKKLKRLTSESLLANRFGRSINQRSAVRKTSKIVRLHHGTSRLKSAIK
jgi:hypothetical protein